MKIQDILLFDWHAGKLYKNENSLFQFFDLMDSNKEQEHSLQSI